MANPFAVAFRDDVIAVGCGGGAGPGVVLFDYPSGAVTSRLGELGTLPGKLSDALALVGKHLYVDGYRARVQVFE